MTHAGPERRGTRRGRVQASLCELCVAVAAAPAALYLAATPTSGLEKTALSQACGTGVAAAWVLLVLLGSTMQLAGVYRNRPEAARAGTLFLALGVLAYGAFLIPSRGAVGVWSGFLHLGLGAYLTARAGRIRGA